MKRYGYGDDPIGYEAARRSLEHSHDDDPALVHYHPDDPGIAQPYPCFCTGPFGPDPADRPSVLDREHPQGIPGCRYPVAPSPATAIEAEARRVAPGATILNLRTDGDGTGIVLVYLPGNVQPYVTWTWATKLTDGSPVRTASGAMLYRGDYRDDRRTAEGDFNSRHNR